MSQKYTRADLVSALNKSVDLPFLKEETEAYLIDQALGYVIDYIPPALWPIVADASQGVDIAVLRKLADVLTEMIADKINVPGLPHSVQMMLITAVMNAIVEAAQKGLHLSAVTEISGTKT